ncbi:MAG: hypothetical protein M3Q08_04770 [Pseudomonadota bacterium]|nr:hypothetical protein [Pseudomonadota bacterium]
MFFAKAASATSVLALSAGIAAAQTTNVGSNTSTIERAGSNNQANVENGAPGSNRNSSSVSFNGNDNRVTVTQVGDDNSSTSRQVGDANFNGVRQTGDRNGAALLQAGNRNSSSVDQHIDPAIGRYADRKASIEQRGSDNSSTVTQVHWDNSATVVQGSGNQASNGSTSDVLQFSASNVARVTMLEGSVEAANRSTIEQTRIDPIVTRNFAEVFVQGFGNGSGVFQMGQDNSTTVTQTGTNNRSSSRTIGNGSRSAVRQTGDSNGVTLSQADGDRNSSTIDQHIDPAIGRYANRQARVEQHGSDNSSTVTQVHWDNSATVVQGIAAPGGPRLLSQGNTSQVIQFSAANVARVSMFEGSVQVPNRSFIEQTRIDPLVTRNLADVSIRGFGNESRVRQAGIGHSARVSMLGGGIGSDGATGRRLGNLSFVGQVGSLLPHVARVSIGGNLAQQGVGTENSIFQQGDHATISHQVVLWQRGQFTSLRIDQLIRGSQDDGGAAADVAQSGTLNQIALTQWGRHRARLTQGFGRNSSLFINQYDTGGQPTRQDGGAGTRVTDPNAIYRGNNVVTASQNGDRNVMSAAQEGADLSATLWQKVGSSDNNMSVIQGARGNNSECNGTTIPCQFAYASSAAVTQSGRLNAGRISQYSADPKAGHRARIEQLGSGFDIHVVTADIWQLGGQSNSATILQTATVGVSSAGDPPSGNSAAQNRQATGDPNAAADEFYWPGGTRPTGAGVLQFGTNLTAAIEQRGRGQIATITQKGSNNEASILQDLGATNATAIIRQDGNGNSYSVTQTQPGQYILVTQSGDNNNATSVIQRGPGS